MIPNTSTPSKKKLSNKLKLTESTLTKTANTVVLFQENGINIKFLLDMTYQEHKILLDAAGTLTEYAGGPELAAVASSAR